MSGTLAILCWLERGRRYIFWPIWVQIFRHILKCWNNVSLTQMGTNSDPGISSNMVGTWSLDYDIFLEIWQGFAQWALRNRSAKSVKQFLRQSSVHLTSSPRGGLDRTCVSQLDRTCRQVNTGAVVAGVGMNYLWEKVKVVRTGINELFCIFDMSGVF